MSINRQLNEWRYLRRCIWRTWWRTCRGSRWHRPAGPGEGWKNWYRSSWGSRCIWNSLHAIASTRTDTSWHLQHISNIEKVQRRLPGLNNLTYKERLAATNLDTIELRRLRTDLIVCYKERLGWKDSSPKWPIGYVSSGTLNSTNLTSPPSSCLFGYLKGVAQPHTDYSTREICSEGMIPLDDIRDFWWVSCRMVRLQYNAKISPKS